MHFSHHLFLTTAFIFLGVSALVGQAPSSKEEFRMIQFRVVQAAVFADYPEKGIGFLQDGSFVPLQYQLRTISSESYLYRGLPVFSLTNPDGTVLARAQIPPEGDDFLLFLKKGTLQNGVWHTELEWLPFDRAKVPLGSYYLVNSANHSIRGSIAQQPFRLKPGERVLLAPSIDTPSNIVASFREESSGGEKILADLAWYHQPKVRQIVYLLPFSEQSQRFGIAAITDYSGLVKPRKPANTLVPLEGGEKSPPSAAPAP